MLENDEKAPSVADTLRSLECKIKHSPAFNLTSAVDPPVSDSLNLTKLVPSLLTIKA